MNTPSPILLLTNQLSVGGAEVYVVNVATWLSRQGIEVHVAATQGDLSSRLPPEVHYHPIPLANVRASLPVAVARIRRLVRQVRPRAIIANSLATAWIGRLASLRARLPVIEVAHGWPVARYGTVAKLMRVNTKVVPVSTEVARRLGAAGLPDSKMQVIENGVDLSPFAAPAEGLREAVRREVFQATGDELIVTNIGRYADQKAQHHILAIALALKESHPRLRYGIIGYGEGEAALRQGIQEGGLEGIVRLLIKRSDVPDLLIASDIYLNCSNWEGMPLSTIEAMGAGLPLVCTQTEGIGALIPSPAEGLTVPVGDTAAMTQAIRRLADDPELARALGAAAKERAERKFSMDRMCRELLELTAAACR